jgi:hypothetical protein
MKAQRARIAVNISLEDTALVCVMGIQTPLSNFSTMVKKNRHVLLRTMTGKI